jgi:hypothetical protein
MSRFCFCERQTDVGAPLACLADSANRPHAIGTQAAFRLSGAAFQPFLPEEAHEYGV